MTTEMNFLNAPKFLVDYVPEFREIYERYIEFYEEVIPYGIFGELLGFAKKLSEATDNSSENTLNKIAKFIEIVAKSDNQEVVGLAVDWLTGVCENEALYAAMHARLGTASQAICTLYKAKGRKGIDVFYQHHNEQYQRETVFDPSSPMTYINVVDFLCHRIPEFEPILAGFSRKPSNYAVFAKLLGFMVASYHQIKLDKTSNANDSFDRAITFIEDVVNTQDEQLVRMVDYTIIESIAFKDEPEYIWIRSQLKPTTKKMLDNLIASS